MDENLNALLVELEQFGIENDAAVSEHSRKMLNIGRETGEFLLVMVRSIRARRILELGTSNGYSTLWLAYALAPVNGRVVTVERQQHKRDRALPNFERSGLLPRIQSHLADAHDFLRTEPAAGFELIFLDSDRSQYTSLWSDLDRVLIPGGLMIADNATSHPGELESLIALAHAAGYLTSIVPVGKGELLALKPS